MCTSFGIRADISWRDNHKFYFFRWGNNHTLLSSFYLKHIYNHLATQLWRKTNEFVQDTMYCSRSLCLCKNCGECKLRLIGFYSGSKAISRKGPRASIHFGAFPGRIVTNCGFLWRDNAIEQHLKAKFRMFISLKPHFYLTCSLSHHHLTCLSDN